MRYFFLHIIFFCLFIGALSGCGLIETDNLPKATPLAPLHPSMRLVRLWSTQVGHGTPGNGLVSYPTVTSFAVFTTHLNGTITAVNKKTGAILWKVESKHSFAAGPVAFQDRVLIVASRSGSVMALDQKTGKILWQKNISGEALAAPVITAQGIILIKTTNGYVNALDYRDGRLQWVFQQIEPNIILERSSRPAIVGHHAIIGFANGNLIHINAETGQLYWIQALAEPHGAFMLQRMIDIDADPIVFDQNTIYVATYQGYLHAIALNGKILWSHPISSYTGMAVDPQMIYLSDAKSVIWAFHRQTGAIAWKQNQLIARSVTAPLVFQNYLIVGDAEGEVHYLSKQSGDILARDHLSGPIFTPPVLDRQEKQVYVLTSKGLLVAYGLPQAISLRVQSPQQQG